MIRSLALSRGMSVRHPHKSFDINLAHPDILSLFRMLSTSEIREEFRTVSLKRIFQGIAVHVSVQESGCWIWSHSKTERYPYHFVAGKRWRVNRLMAALCLFDWNPDKHVCHKCDNTYCANPDHLFMGTQLDNIRDAKSKGRTPVGEKRWNSKLTEDQAKDVIREFWGMSQELPPYKRCSILGEKYGMLRNSIHGVVFGRLWKNLDCHRRSVEKEGPPLLSKSDYIRYSALNRKPISDTSNMGKRKGFKISDEHRRKLSESMKRARKEAGSSWGKRSKQTN